MSTAVITFIPSIVDGIKTMNSKDIAEYTGKQHSHILRDIREMLLKVQHPNLVSVEMTTDFYRENFLANKMTASFDLDEELTLTLVSGYDVVLRKRIIAAWKVAERDLAKATPVVVIPQSFSAALRLAADAQEKLEEAILQIAHDAPKVEYVEKFIEVGFDMNLRDAWKSLHVSPTLFSKHLVDKGVLYEKGKAKTKHAYQESTEILEAL